MAKTNWAIQGEQVARFRSIVADFKFAYLGDYQETLARIQDELGRERKTLASLEETLEKYKNGDIIACSRSQEEIQAEADSVSARIEVIKEKMVFIKGTIEPKYKAALGLVDSALYKAYCDSGDKPSEYKAALTSWLKSAGFQPEEDTIRVLKRAIGISRCLKGRSLVNANYNRPDIIVTLAPEPKTKYAEVILRTLVSLMGNTLPKRRYEYVTDSMKRKLEKESEKATRK